MQFALAKNLRSEERHLTTRSMRTVGIFVPMKVLSANQDSVLSSDFGLRMIGIDSQVGEQQLFPARVMASTVWLCRHKYSVNRCERFGVVELQDPSLLACIVFVENP